MRQPIVQPSSSSGAEEIQHICEAERLRRYRANVSPEQRYTRYLQKSELQKTVVYEVYGLWEIILQS